MRIQKGNILLSSLQETFALSKMGPGCNKVLAHASGDLTRKLKPCVRYDLLWNSQVNRWVCCKTVFVLSTTAADVMWCWLTWKTQQVLRNNHFFDRSHSPVRKDPSYLSTIQMSSSADYNNHSIGLVLAQTQISYFLAICHSCLFRQVTKSWIRSLVMFSNTLVFLTLPVQAFP